MYGSTPLPPLEHVDFYSFALYAHTGIIYVATRTTDLPLEVLPCDGIYWYTVLSQVDAKHMEFVLASLRGVDAFTVSRFRRWVRINDGVYAGDLGIEVELQLDNSFISNDEISGIRVLLPGRLRFFSDGHTSGFSDNGDRFSPKSFTVNEVAAVLGYTDMRICGENTFGTSQHLFIDGLYVYHVSSRDEIDIAPIVDPFELYPFTVAGVPTRSLSSRLLIQLGDPVVIQESVPVLGCLEGIIIVRTATHVTVRTSFMDRDRAITGLPFGSVRRCAESWVQMTVDPFAWEMEQTTYSLDKYAMDFCPNVPSGSAFAENVSVGHLAAFQANARRIPDLLAPNRSDALIGKPVIVVDGPQQGVGVLMHVSQISATVYLRGPSCVDIPLEHIVATCVYALLHQ